MRIRLLGFEWKLGKTISCDSLFARLKTAAKKPTKFGKYSRLLYVGQKNDYHIGLFLTIKDEKKICELKSEEGTYKVNVRELDANTSPVEFNFVVVNRNTCRGLYQQYHTACSFNQFSIFVQNHYDALVNGDAEVSEMDWTILVRKESLSALLKSMKKIRSVEFDMTTLTAENSLFTPLSGVLRRETHKLAFEASTDPHKIASKIAAIAAATGISRAKVSGKNADGYEETLQLIDNPDSFGDFDYDDIAEEAVLNLAKVEQSPFIKTMLKTVEDHKTLFENP